MRPYLLERIQVNSVGVRMRFTDMYPCLNLAVNAFHNAKDKSIEVRLYACCLDFDRLIDEYSKSK